MQATTWAGSLWQELLGPGEKIAERLEAQPTKLFHLASFVFSPLSFSILSYQELFTGSLFIISCGSASTTYTYLCTVFSLADGSKRKLQRTPTPNPSLTQSGKRIHLRSASSMSAKGPAVEFLFETKTLRSTNSLILKQSCHTLAELSELCTFMPVLGGLRQQLRERSCWRSCDPHETVHFIFSLHDLPKTGAKLLLFGCHPPVPTWTQICGKDCS